MQGGVASTLNDLVPRSFRVLAIDQSGCSMTSSWSLNNISASFHDSNRLVYYRRQTT